MSYAKFRPPFLPDDLLQRTWLFDLLDENRHCKVIWIQGQAGAGKTTLAASYIKQCQVDSLWYRVDTGDDDPATFFHYFSHAAGDLLSDNHQPLPRPTPESFSNLVPFSRLFFRELFDRLPRPSILVFDNFQALGPDAAINEIIAAALGEIPQGMNAILISRSAPPESLSRMIINRTMAILDQHALKLTNDEVLSLSRLKFPHRFQAKAAKQINETADGWIAGLVLLLERGGYDDTAKEVEKEYFFGYFADEIFDTLDRDRQRFLLYTACLDSITPAVARKLTGMPETLDILEDLCARHYFTSRSDQTEPEYQYHPLFRSFLLRRREIDMGSSLCQQMTARAAHILAHDGQVEEAMVLAKDAEDWPLLSELINRQAPSLLAQQRFYMLEQWLKQVPDDVLGSSSWLSHWLGCCRLPFNQQESKHYFESAFNGFKAQEEKDGMLLCASGVILAILTEWDDFRSMDPWIAVLDDLVKDTPVYPSEGVESMVVLAMSGALLFRMPQHPAMERWEARASRLIRSNELDITIRMDIGNVLVHWQYWKGNLAAASQTTDIMTQLAGTGGSSTLSRLQAAMNHAIHDWHIADFDRCLDSIDSGLALAEEMDIHIMDDRLMAQSVYASLSRNDLPTAKRFLHAMKPTLLNGRRLSMSHYHILSSYYHLTAGDLEMALEHGQTALDLNKEVGTPYPEALACFILSQIHVKLGEPELGARLLATGKRLAKEMNSRTLELLYELISAWFSHLQGRDDAALSHLRQGMTLQSKMGFLNFPGWRNFMMAPLLLKALENNIEPDFVKRLIRKHDLRLDASTQTNREWPWPVKITTLGRFSLLIDDHVLKSGGRGQQKPLEMLKVLIAMGGSEVSKERMADVLWPDTDGDKAARAMDTTLHRFRKLVGYEQAILVQHGKLSLNSRICWSDTGTLEHLLEQTEINFGQASGDSDHAVKYTEKLFTIYQGEFLSDDNQTVCIINYRERLHHRYLNKLDLLGRYWENQSDWDQALSVYQRMLELDDRQETIHQRLILCFQKKGMISQAMKAYERCCNILLTHYGIPPSPKTKAIHQSLYNERS